MSGPIIRPLFDPGAAGRPMRVAGFVSGSGTNMVKIIEHQQRLEAERGISPFEVIFIFSDRSDGACQGERIALEAGLPYVSYDIRRFHQLRGLKRTTATPAGLAARQKFDSFAGRLVKALEIDLIALAGYMSVVTLPRAVNVHPADLSLTDASGRRLFTGDEAVREAIAAGQKELRASTIWVDQGVDTGPLLMVSRPLEVSLPIPLEKLKKNPMLLKKTADEHQQRLKEIGDWQIFPLTIQYIAEGRFGLDEKGAIYFDGQLVPQGLRL